MVPAGKVSDYVFLRCLHFSQIIQATEMIPLMLVMGRSGR